MLLDFILLFIVTFCIFMGYKNGITRMIVSIVIFAFSIVIVTQIYKTLERNFFDSRFGKELVFSVSDNVNGEIKKITDSIVVDAPFLAKYFITDETLVSAESAVEQLSKKVVQALITIPLLIISFLLLKLILFLVKLLTSKTQKIPIIGGVDALLGSVCGFGVGIVLIWITYMSLCYLQFLPSAVFLQKQLDDSLVIMLITDFLNK